MNKTKNMQTFHYSTFGRTEQVGQLSGDSWNQSPHYIQAISTSGLDKKTAYSLGKLQLYLHIHPCGNAA